MRGLLIDPVAKTVTETEVTGVTNQEQMASLHDILRCDGLIQRVFIVRGLDLWVDEAARNGSKVFPAFWFDRAETQPFYGRALILGRDGHNIAGFDQPLDALTKLVRFER